MEINNISGTLLAEKMGVSQPTISRVISTNHIPSSKEKSMIWGLARFFGVDEEWIRFGELVCHSCQYSFENADSVCPMCNEKLTHYIKRKIRLNEKDIELNLLNRLYSINYYNRFIKKINITLENLLNCNFEDSSLEINNLVEIERVMDLRETGTKKLEVLKSEFEEVCEQGMTLEDYLNEDNYELEEYKYEYSLNARKDES
jgi:transcriptional regulator with XRE-family HTH domain